MKPIELLKWTLGGVFSANYFVLLVNTHSKIRTGIYKHKLFFLFISRFRQITLLPTIMICEAKYFLRMSIRLIHKMFRISFAPILKRFVLLMATSLLNNTACSTVQNWPKVFTKQLLCFWRRFNTFYHTLPRFTVQMYTRQE